MNTKSLISGAYGDALGWPVEFSSVKDIQRRYGPKGIQVLDIQGNLFAEITDDTQMTLFTAEGLLTAYTANNCQIEYDIDILREHVYHAYLRWYSTQYSDYHSPPTSQIEWSTVEGILNFKGILKHPELHNKRAPGGTCLTSLGSNQFGTPEHPLNNSKGCGGVMRAAPVGLLYGTPHAFDVGIMTAALTHSHPSGYLTAGFLAHFLAGMREGPNYSQALRTSLNKLTEYKGHEETYAILKNAIWLGLNNTVTIEQGIAQLGEGWVGEEALAISLFCFLRHVDHSFESIMAAAVNHKGDSDSTGAILGNMLGVLQSPTFTVPTYTDTLELGSLIVQIERDLVSAREGTHTSDPNWKSKYGL